MRFPRRRMIRQRVGQRSRVQPSLRIALLLVLGFAALWLGGCFGVQLAIVVDTSPQEEVSIADSGEPVRPYPTPTPKVHREDISPTSATPKTPTPIPTPTPAPRVPASSPPDRIVAPSINLDAPVVTVGWYLKEDGGRWFSEWETASYAAGYHKGSALPGQKGNTVISGHHNIEGRVFERLKDLELGDPVILYADGRPYRYRVVDKFVVKEKGASPEQRRQNALWIAPTRDERLTLVTCWPDDGNDYRLIVIAKPVSE